MSRMKDPRIGVLFRGTSSTRPAPRYLTGFSSEYTTVSERVGKAVTYYMASSNGPHDVSCHPEIVGACFADACEPVAVHRDRYRRQQGVLQVKKRRVSSGVIAVFLATLMTISVAEGAAQNAKEKRQSALPNTLSQEEAKQGFTLLFNGKSLDNFKGAFGFEVFLVEVFQLY